MRIGVVALQVLLSIVVVASAMPVALVTVPQVREGTVGLVVAVSGLLVAFLLIRLAWPRRTE